MKTATESMIKRLIQWFLREENEAHEEQIALKHRLGANLTRLNIYERFTQWKNCSFASPEPCDQILYFYLCQIELLQKQSLRESYTNDIVGALSINHDSTKRVVSQLISEGYWSNGYLPPLILGSDNIC